jgi:hypothetical protein
MDVTFELISPQGKVWTEAALARAGDGLATVVAGLKPLYGVLVITVDADTETTITDDFNIMLHQICLRGVQQLHRGGSYTYTLAADPGAVSFTVTGDTVQISGAVRDDLVCDRTDLVEALLDCGARYVAFMDAVVGADANSYAQGDLADAQAAIAD